MSFRIRMVRLLESPRFPFVAAGIAVFLTLPSLWMGFFADDYLQRAVFLQPPAFEGMFGGPFTDMFTFADGDPERMGRLVDLGIFPWLTLPEVVFRFFRPATVVTHWVDYALWPNSPALMHVHNLAWFGAMVGVVGFVYRRLLGAGSVAGLAALLFAIDDSHAWPAAWIANRNDLIALFLCGLVLLCHDANRKFGDRRAGLAGVSLYVVALFAKESAIAVTGYLFAYALFLDDGPRVRRFLALLPYAVATLAWRAVYVWMGYGAYGSDGYVDPVESPLQFATALLVHVPLLLQGQWSLIASDLYSLGPPAAQPYLVASGITLVVVLAVLLAPVLRRDRLARFFCLGMLLALVPVSAAGPQDRLLVFAGVGGSGLLAQFLSAVWRGAEWGSAGRPSHRIARGGAYALVAVHLVIAPLGLPMNIMVLDMVGDVITDMAVDSVPTSSDIQDKTIVLTNIGNYPFATYLYIVRGLAGEPAPAHARSLAPVSMSAVPTTLMRTGERTLRATPDGGYPWSLFRDRYHPLEAGQRIELTGMTAQIVEVAEAGYPASVEFQFDRPLEDLSLLWFRAEGLTLVKMAPPRVGESIRIGPLGVE